MLKISFMIFFLLLTTSCTEKKLLLNHEKTKCEKIELELNNLRKKKHMNFLGSVSTFILKGYSYNKNDKYINEKIKVLESKLNGCLMI